MKKIIRIFIGSLEVGGTEKHLLYVLPELVKRGWHIHVWVLTRGGALADEMQQKGIIVKSLLSESELKFTRKFQFPRLLGRIIRLSVCIIKLIREFRRDRIHPIHFFLPESYIVGMFSATLSRFLGPKLMSRRSMNYYQRRHFGMAWIESILHSMNSIVLGNSLSVIHQLNTEEKIPKPQLRLIYNGIDLQPYQTVYDRDSVNAELNIAKDSLVLIIVANVIPYKGHFDLLQALSNIKSKLPRNWDLLCIGQDSGIVPKLKKFCEQNNMATHVHWLGSTKEVAQWLSCADIGILSSHEEGFSNALLEYMAAGLPVIATNVGGNAEAVLHGETGIIVPAKRPEVLGEAILELALDKDKRARFGKAGKARITEQFSLERCINAYESLYQSLIEGKLPPVLEDFTIPCVD
jgi:glycosyltransferase involved in cell wall biosynthesis